MNKLKIAIITGFVTLMVTGFLLGSAVTAAISGPGSSEDPLATKSYVDAEVAKIQNQIDKLKAEIQQLKK